MIMALDLLACDGDTLCHDQPVDNFVRIEHRKTRRNDLLRVSIIGFQDHSVNIADSLLAQAGLGVHIDLEILWP